jgi:hypothetical protein
MKKIIIISAVILSSALTAFAITRSADKQEVTKLKIEKTDFAVKAPNSSNTANVSLASAD